MIPGYKRNNLCVDCDDDACSLQGMIRPDCPKYICDRTWSDYEDCESCSFFKEFAEKKRKEYEKV